jgi:hypothetical protein
LAITRSPSSRWWMQTLAAIVRGMEENATRKVVSSVRVPGRAARCLGTVAVVQLR